MQNKVSTELARWLGRGVPMMFLMALLSLGSLTGCDDQGPAEEAGEAVDDSMEDARDAFEDAGDAAEEAWDDAEDEVTD